MQILMESYIEISNYNYSDQKTVNSSIRTCVYIFVSTATYIIWSIIYIVLPQWLTG